MTLAQQIASSTTGLRGWNVSVSYRGHHAVQGVSLDAPLGRITGLIGPNGAGKTTTFNAINGLVRTDAGTVTLFGSEITHRPPAARARMGLGRTFQRMELVNAMSVRTNVALGAECRAVGSRPLAQLWSSRAERRRISCAADNALETCGVQQLSTRPVGSLSTGQRRMVELARVLAGDFRLLLLDEPSSGLDEEETFRFGQILQRARAERGLGILLVEHDMALVMSACDHLFVLDFGRLIFDGTPAQAQTSDVVRAAYLGDDLPGVES
jgi:ABC-type branched-subunit amino acid transport system ATPase component